MNTKHSYITEEFRENEYTTNKIATFLLLGFVIIGIANQLFVNFHFINEVGAVGKRIFLPCNIILVCIAVTAWIFKFRAPWIKYMLISGALLISSVSFFVYTVYANFLVLMPMILATRYFNRKLIVAVSVINISLFMGCCIFGVIFDSKSQVIKSLHENICYNIWQTQTDAFSSVTIPILLTLLFLAVFSVNMTTSGRKLINEKINDNKRIASVHAQLNMASKIQKSVLPQSQFATTNNHFELYAYESPAKEVCGDFYDYFMIDDNTMGVLVADVSDKGAAAAMFMMSAKKAIQCAVLSCHNLTDAIELANKLICNDNQYGMFLTLWMGVIDTRTGVGKYVNAGHPYPLIRHGDGNTELIENEPNLFIGNFPDKTPKVNTLFLKPQDTLFIYTDGLTDTANINGERFGFDRVAQLLSGTYSTTKELVMNITTSVNDFAGEAQPFDDITLLAFQCNTVEETEKLDRTVTCGKDGTAALNNELQDELLKINCPDLKRRNIGVVVDEICNNIDEYAYEENGEITLHAEIGANFIQMTFSDNGKIFNPILHEDPEINGIPQIGGFGIYFVKQLSDKVEYEYKDNQNKLTVTVIWNN